MAKGRKGRTFRKKMRGGLLPVEPVDISTYNTSLLPKKPISLIKPSYENISDYNLYADDVMGGKLRRTRKRRMTKRRKNSRKSRKSKSRKMRGGFFMGDYLPSFLKPGQQKKQENFNMRKELNTDFENQPVVEKINRIEEINDNITNFSPEYEQQMRENMNKYNLQQQQK
jgi:hypothetical protein